jgi:hypothetical protein
MNKIDLTRACRTILNKYKPGQKIIEENSFLMELFSKHHQWSIKIGIGVDYITVKKTQWGTNCFTIKRIDGTETDISYLQCVNGKSSDLSDVKAACRDAIRGIVAKFRNENVKFGVTVCPLTGDTLLKNNTHIDHYDLTFDEVVTLWLSDKDIKQLHSTLNEGSVDGETEIYFNDSEIIKDFVSFHNNNTHLRAVSKIANLSILK